MQAPHAQVQQCTQPLLGSLLESMTYLGRLILTSEYCFADFSSPIRPPAAQLWPLSIGVQPFSQQAVTVQKELTAAQLRHAAKMARLSGLCYRPTDQLSDSLDKEGLRLISSGQTHFTRWGVVEICIWSFDAPKIIHLGSDALSYCADGMWRMDLQLMEVWMTRDRWHQGPAIQARRSKLVMPKEPIPLSME